MTVRIERPVPHLAELIMDRPEALNALSTEQAPLPRRPARWPASRVNVVIISSALERAFCVGADLKERPTSPMMIFGPSGGLRRVLRCPVGTCVPTIAAVDGFALGGGFELALCCDLIVASDRPVSLCRRSGSV